MDRREAIRKLLVGASVVPIASTIGVHTSGAGSQLVNPWNDVLLVSIEIDPEYEHQESAIQGLLDLVKGLVVEQSGRDIPVLGLEATKITIHTRNGVQPETYNVEG